MTEFEKADVDGSGAIDKTEWDKLLLDDKRMQIEAPTYAQKKRASSKKQGATTKDTLCLAATAFMMSSDLLLSSPSKAPEPA